MANTTIYPYGTDGQLPSSIGVINDLVTGDADKALSAEMGKRLRKAITGLLNALSPTAFTGEKPTDADLDIYAPKFTITLPTDTRVDMTNQNAQVESGDSYTNTFSLNETAEEGYVLRLSATMEGGGEISADATTGVVSTNNVTGNITIVASAGVPQMKVHSYTPPYTTDENDKKYMADGVNNFRLYNQSDASYSTSNYPSGYYANGKDDGYRVGYGGSSGYRDLLVGDDFTVVLRDVAVYAQSGQNSAYDASQIVTRFYDRSNISTGSRDVLGQFQLQLATGDTAQGNVVKSGSMRPHISYIGSSGAVYKKFYQEGTTGYVPITRAKISGSDTRTHTYHVVMSYNNTTKKATAWVVDINNETSTKELKLSAEIDITGKLILPCIAMKNDSSLLGGLDVYNYAMSEADVKNEFSIS